MTKIFIDGSAGTTGLRIADRLSHRSDLEIIRLTEENRKDPLCRKKALTDADIAFLCLPDAAAREAVELLGDGDTVIIDTSTAHRTAEGWDYGFPEIGGRKEKIAKSKRIANPGCHASGFVSLIAPLTQSGIIPADIQLSCFSLTGYSGGGKKMIAEYEEENRKECLCAPGMYGLTQAHKHLPEMSVICGLETLPVFCPVVAPYYSGMQVTVPLFAGQIKGSINDIKEVYKNYYSTGLVRFCENTDSFLYAGDFSGRDDMAVTVCGNEDRILLVSRFDNLGKGASGSAIQNMNIVMGIPEDTGLVTKN